MFVNILVFIHSRECVNQAVNSCGPGEPFRVIGHAVYRQAKKRDVAVVPNLCGHGIGKVFHGPPGETVELIIL